MASRTYNDGLFFFPPDNPPRNTAPSTRGGPPAPTNLPLRSFSIKNEPKPPPRPKNYGEGDEIEFINKLRLLYTQARDKKRLMYDNWHRNYRLVNNKAGNPSPNSTSPIPRDSEIYPTLSALVAWMTDQNTLVDAFPAADPGSPFYSYTSALSNDLSAVIYTNWLIEDYDAEIKLGLWDSFMYGAGILKNVWDQSLDGGMGNAKIRRVDPYSFFPDPNATSMEDAEYFVEVRRMSLNEVIRRFPNSAAALELSASGDSDVQQDQKPSLTGVSTRPDPPNLGSLVNSGSQWSLPRRQNRHSTLPLITVYEFWIRENDFEEESYEDLNESERPELADAHCKSIWRAVVIAGGEILLDEYADELWSHAQHPYERYVFDDIGEFYGISLVDHLAFPQIYINRLLTAMQQNAELTGNPIFLDPSNSGISRVGIVNRPGQRLSVNPMAMQNGKGPSWLTPPTMPTQIMDLVNFWISRIENTSGLSAIVKGATPNSRNSQGVMSSIQEAAFVRIRSGLRNLEKTLERCIIKVGDLIVDNYTDRRIMAIIGPEGKNTSKVLQSYHFYGPSSSGAQPLKFTIQIKAGSSAPTSRQARTAEADTLYGMGGIDRIALLEAHQYPHAQEINDRIEKEIQAGTFNPPGARQRSKRSS